MLAISSLSIGCRNIVLQFSFPKSEKLNNKTWKKIIRKCEKCLCQNFMGFFSNICKVILKGVSNTIETGYSITIIKREYSWYNRGYSFKRNQGFDFNFFQNIYYNKPVYFSS